MASRAICVMVLGVVPLELPTPALSSMMTRRRSCECVDQRGVPVVEIAAEVLEQDQGHRAFPELAERVVDAIRCAHHLYRALDSAELRLDRFILRCRHGRLSL